MLKGMGFPVAALKPAAWLLFGASAIFAPIAAQALTFDWTLSGTDSQTVNGVATTVTRSGSGRLGATLVSGTTYQIQSISGTWAGETITGLNASFTYRNGVTFIQDNQFIYDTTILINTNFKPATGLGYAFTTANYWGNFFLDPIRLNAYISESTFVSAANTINPGSFTGSIELVPAPLPLLGLPAVLFYSRKIKKRIKQRSLTSVSS
jgi:hypothetical protein